MTARIFTPREYQAPAIDHLLDIPRDALWMAMGGGKTVSVLTALTHLSLVEDPFPALVIAPLRVATSTWPDEVRKWSHLHALRVVAITGSAEERRRAMRQRAEIYTINYENIPWLVEELAGAWPYRVVVADECFTGDTRVSTPQGLKRIDSIRVGEFVHTLYGNRKVTHVHEQEASSLVRLHLSDGRKIQCTPNHLFWTQDGWCEAQHTTGRTVVCSEGMRDVPPEVWVPCVESERSEVGALLLAWLRNERLAVADSKGKAAGGCAEEPCPLVENGRPMEQGCPDAGLNPGKAFSYPEGEGRCVLERPWWERAGDERVRGARRESPRHRLGVEPRDQHQGVERGRLGGSPDELQTGFCTPDGQSLHRSGREFPRDGTGESEGCQEASRFGSARVDRVESVQCKNPVKVWDLEVEGAHHYFAGGVLVHNCTKLKSFRLRQGSKRAKALAKVAWQSERFVELTGTPSPNGLVDLWGQLWFLDRGERLGRSFDAFRQRWFNTIQVGADRHAVQLTPLPFAREQIEDRLRDICLSIDVADYLDVREPVINTIRVELPAKARRLYRDMEREMFLALECGTEVEAFNAASKTIKCLQLANGAIYTDDTSTTFQEIHDAKLQALESIIEEAAGAPVLVAYHFKSDLARLHRAFPQGRALDADPDTIKEWNRGAIPILFAHPASAGHGLNLQDGGNILAFFGHWWNLEEFQQIIERIGPTRQAQAGHDRPVFIHHIVAADTVDELVMARRESKREVQDLLMEAMKRKGVSA